MEDITHQITAKMFKLQLFRLQKRREEALELAGRGKGGTGDPKKKPPSSSLNV